MSRTCTEGALGRSITGFEPPSAVTCGLEYLGCFETLLFQGGEEGGVEEGVPAKEVRRA